MILTHGRPYGASLLRQSIPKQNFRTTMGVMGKDNKIRSAWSASLVRTNVGVNSKPSGAQSLERALRILREIASRGPLGLRLIDLQHRTGFAKPTAHRIVRTLVRHNFVSYDDSWRRYFLDAEISILSVSAPTDLPDLQELSRQGLSCARAGYR
jgi:hypothetical protein